MAARGGRRVGAGRPTDQAKSVEAKQQALMLAEISKLALKHLPEVFSKILDLARGVKVQEEEDGPVYRRIPDKACLMWIMEQAVGKAPVKKEVRQDQSITLIANVPRPKAAEVEIDGEAVDADE